MSAWVENLSRYYQCGFQCLCQSVMTWGVISAEKELVIVRVEGKFNCLTYYEMLESCFFDYAGVVLPENDLFQYDNVSANVCHLTMSYLKSRKISVLPWPLQSPDISLIKDLWEIVSEKVYKHGKTYQTKDDLWCTIVAAWDALPRSLPESV